MYDIQVRVVKIVKYSPRIKKVADHVIPFCQGAIKLNCFLPLLWESSSNIPIFQLPGVDAIFKALKRILPSTYPQTCNLGGYQDLSHCLKALPIFFLYPQFSFKLKSCLKKRTKAPFGAGSWLTTVWLARSLPRSFHLTRSKKSIWQVCLFSNTYINVN